MTGAVFAALWILIWARLAHIKGMSLHITSTLNQGLDVAGDSRYMNSLVGDGNNSINHQLRLDTWWVKQELFNGKLSLSAGQISGFDFFGYIPQDFSHFVTLGPFYAPFALYNSYSSADPTTTPAAMMPSSRPISISTTEPWLNPSRKVIRAIQRPSWVL